KSPLGTIGIDRYRLYLMAIYTGLRASELASLKRGSFDWEANTITVHAGYTKNGQTAILPIHPVIATELKSWIDELPQDAKLWKGTWAKKKRGADMLKKDLQEAKISFELDGKRFDFHALRTQFITGLVKSGAKPKDAQTLARHSSFVITGSNVGFANGFRFHILHSR
ncbi:MAG: site-specific integrase, partial [Planctomycetaceae bacterium]|nr:site-specific integrase [Planctomycetaceae bacterium]